MNDRYLVAYEHQTLRLAPHGPLAAEALRAFLDRIPGIPASALTPTHDGLRTGAFCGLLEAGNWGIEILPKIYDGTELGPNRGLLIRMLGVCFDLPVWQDGLAAADASEDLLTIVIRTFLHEAQRQLRRGWIQTYVHLEERLTRPRGRLSVTEQLRRGRAQAHKLYCEFDELSVDNGYNQAVMAALVIARTRVPVGSRLAAHADQLVLALADVDSVRVTVETIEALPRDRLTERYDRLLMLSAWLLQLSGPDVHSGDERGLSLLFDMNRLFQDFVSSALQEAIRRHPLRDHLRLTQERPVQCLVRDINSKGRFMMRPDLCLMLDGRLIAILDAKWKRLEPVDDVQEAGISQADLYQLLAYGHTYGCDALTLVYPYHASLSNWLPPLYRYAPYKESSIHLAVKAFNLDATAEAADALLAAQLVSRPQPVAATAPC